MNTEHAEEFKALQNDYSSILRRRQHNILNAQLLEDEKRKEMKKASKVSDLSQDNHVYKNFGRIYLQIPVSKLRDEVKENIKYCDEQLDKLRSNRDNLNKTADEYEKKIDEFLKTNAISPDELEKSETKQ